MFVGDYSQWLPPPPEEPPPRPRLTPRQERLLMRILAFNIVLLVVAPIGGATVLQAIAAWLQAR